METLKVTVLVLAGLSLSEGLALDQNKLSEKNTAKQINENYLIPEIIQYIPYRGNTIKGDQSIDFEELDRKVADASLLLKSQDYFPNLDRPIFLNGKIDLTNIPSLQSEDNSEKRTLRKYLEQLVHRSQDVIDEESCASINFERLVRCLVTSYPSLYCEEYDYSSESSDEEESHYEYNEYNESYDQESDEVHGAAHVDCLFDAIKEYELCLTHN